MVGDMADFCGKEVGTIKKWITETKKYTVGKDGAVRTEKENNEHKVQQAVIKSTDLHGIAKAQNVADMLGRSKATLYRWLKDSKKIKVENGIIIVS